MLTDFTVEPSGPSAPNKFVIRFRGSLVRDDEQMPLLFDTFKQAEDKRLSLEAVYD